MKLEALDKDFSASHMDVIDLVDEESSDLEKEHKVMDKHEENVTSSSLQLHTLLKAVPLYSDTMLLVQYHANSPASSATLRILKKACPPWMVVMLGLHYLSSTRRK